MHHEGVQQSVSQYYHTSMGDVLVGFLNADEQARGRPAGVAIAGDGALLVADDVGNTVWRVAAPRP